MAKRLSAQEVFGFLRPEQVHAISEASERITCAAGEAVYQQGGKAEHLYVVLNGVVSLRLPGESGTSVLIDQLEKGAMFGTCICLERDSYALTAQCVEDSEILKLEGSVLKKLMDRDRQMGYALQTRISAVYFGRYIDTMKKLQAIVMNIPFESD